MLYALVVIYNKSCDESTTLACLRNYAERIRVVVFDNSTKENSNFLWCKERGYIYHSEKRNIGLSKAYNYVLRTLKKTDSDYIIILDDDTSLPDSYFQEVFQKIKSHQYHLLLPVVLSGKEMISPCNMEFDCKPKGVSDRKQINIAKISAINSGMVVRLDVYEKINYDENMFLECIDHDFMNRVRQDHLRILVLESEIYQDYSLESKGNLETAILRFKIRKKDIKTYYKKYKNMLICHAYIVWIAIKLAKKYRSLRFFRS